MIPLKMILVASDLSEKSAVALERAALLAEQSGARLEILHVLETAPLAQADGSPVALRELTENARRVLERQAEQSVARRVAYQGRVEQGKDFVTIIRAAREMQADLIVIAAHGSHSLRDIFLGTTAEKVVRKSGLPVLVARNPAVAPYRRVLVPTDFTEASRQALLAALALAPRARLDFLHVYEVWGESRLSLADTSGETQLRYHQQVREGAKAAMAEWLRGVDLGPRQVERHFRHGHPGALIPQVAGELEAELVAMGTAGRTGLPHILLGSVAEHTLREAPCDVLTVRPGGFRFELP